MAMVPICSVSGRSSDLDSVISAGENALMLNDATVFDGNVVEQLAREGFGVMKADSYIARDITELSFSCDESSGLVTVTTLSPSHLLRRGNQAPLVGAVLPFIADALEDATFAAFVPGPDSDSSSMPIEAFLAKTQDMVAGDFVIEDDRWDVENTGPFQIPIIKGMKSLSQISNPYIKEIEGKANRKVESESDMLRAVGELFIKMADTPKEFDAMLELEFGPVFQYYWMAYASMRQSNNKRDRDLRSLYDTKMNDRLRISSPFTSASLVFSDTDISGLKARHLEYLEGKGIDLNEKDLKSV